MLPVEKRDPVSAAHRRHADTTRRGHSFVRDCTRSTEGAAHVTAADRVEASLAAKLEPDAFGSDLRHGVSVERRGGIALAGR
jgi:hypothetical protein